MELNRGWISRKRVRARLAERSSGSLSTARALRRRSSARRAWPVRWLARLRGCRRKASGRLRVPVSRFPRRSVHGPTVRGAQCTSDRSTLQCKKRAGSSRHHGFRRRWSSEGVAVLPSLPLQNLPRQQASSFLSSVPRIGARRNCVWASPRREHVINSPQRVGRKSQMPPLTPSLRLQPTQHAVGATSGQMLELPPPAWQERKTVPRYCSSRRASRARS